MQIQCVVAEAKNRVEVQTHSIREARPDEVVAETLFSAISPGTELRCLAGNERNAGSFPMITGYSLVARVVRGAGDLHEGDLVFFNGTPLCPEGISRSWGGHVSHVVAPPSAAIKLPAALTRVLPRRWPCSPSPCTACAGPRHCRAIVSWWPAKG